MSRASSVVKFPIGRVVREHRIGIILAATPEAEAIGQAAISVRRAIETLRRQEATLNLHAARESKKVTPKQHAQLVAKNMRHIYACQDEDRAAAAPPLDADERRVHARDDARLFRALADKLDAEAGDNDDGGSAAYSLDQIADRGAPLATAGLSLWCYRIPGPMIASTLRSVAVTEIPPSAASRGTGPQGAPSSPSYS
jgi:hypothetical protein